jgi:hypothetical protein
MLDGTKLMVDALMDGCATLQVTRCGDAGAPPSSPLTAQLTQLLHLLCLPKAPRASPSRADSSFQRRLAFVRPYSSVLDFSLSVPPGWTYVHRKLGRKALRDFPEAYSPRTPSLHQIP